MSDGSRKSSLLGSQDHGKENPLGRLFKKVQLKGPQSVKCGDRYDEPFTISPNPNIRPLAQNSCPRPRNEYSRVYIKVLEQQLNQEIETDDIEDEIYIRDPDETSRIWANMRGKKIQHDAPSEDSQVSNTTCIESTSSSTGTIVAVDAMTSDSPSQLQEWRDFDTLFENESTHYAIQITQTNVGGNYQAWKKFFRDYCENAYYFQRVPPPTSPLGPGFKYLPALVCVNERQRLEACSKYTSFWDCLPETFLLPFMHTLQNSFPSEKISIGALNPEYEVFRATNLAENLMGILRVKSLSAHVLFHQNFLDIEDVQQDWRFQNNDFVLEYGIRHYAGMPMLTEDGHIFGVISVYGTQPSVCSDVGFAALEYAANNIMKRIEDHEESTTDYDDTARFSLLSKASSPRVSRGSVQLSEADEDYSDMTSQDPFGLEQDLQGLRNNANGQDNSPPLHNHLPRVVSTVRRPSSLAGHTPSSSSKSDCQFENTNRFTMTSNLSTLSIDENDEMPSENNDATARLSQPYRPFSYEAHRPISCSDITSLNNLPPNTPIMSSKGDAVAQAADDMSHVSIRRGAGPDANVRPRSDRQHTGDSGHDQSPSNHGSAGDSPDDQSRNADSFYTAATGGDHSSTTSLESSPKNSPSEQKGNHANYPHQSDDDLVRFPTANFTETVNARAPITQRGVHTTSSNLAAVDRRQCGILLNRQEDAPTTNLIEDLLADLGQRPLDSRAGESKSHVSAAAPERLVDDRLAGFNHQQHGQESGDGISHIPDTVSGICHELAPLDYQESKEEIKGGYHLTPREHELLYSSPEQYAHLQPDMARYPYERGNHLDYTKHSPQELSGWTYEEVNEVLRLKKLKDYFAALEIVQHTIERHAKTHGWDMLYIALIQRNYLPANMNINALRKSDGLTKDLKKIDGYPYRLQPTKDGLSRSFVAAYGISKEKLQTIVPDPAFHEMVLSSISHISWQDKNFKYGDGENVFSTGRAIKVHRDRNCPNEGIVLGAFRKPRAKPQKPKANATELEELIKLGQAIKPLLVKESTICNDKEWLQAICKSRMRAKALQWATLGNPRPGWGYDGNPLPGYGLYGKPLSSCDLDGRSLVPLATSHLSAPPIVANPHSVRAKNMIVGPAHIKPTRYPANEAIELQL